MKTIRKVSEQDDVIAVAKLADEIWRDHFVAIIGIQQVEYMLDRFQSPAAITTQIATGYEYYLLLIDGIQTGYLGLLPEPDVGKMMISKIYIRREKRGKGLGNYLLDFVKQQCDEKEIDSIWLTVNRNNDKTIKWYREKGFTVIDEVKKDIGGGFFMDDFIMQLDCPFPG